MTTIPYQFQLKGVRRVHKMKGRTLLALDMGLGKSFLSLLYAMRHPEVRPIIVVCPASLKWNWASQAHIHCGMRGEVLSTTKPEKEGYNTKASLYIINFDILHFWLEKLKRTNPQLVIIDECQACMSRQTRRTKATATLCQGVPHVLALSGTPLTNRPAELWPTLNILRPDIFPSFWQFAFKFCSPRRTPWGWDFRGASNLDILHNLLLREVMVRYRKSEVLEQLPEKQRTVLPVELEDRKQYQKAEDDFLTWLEEVYGPAKVRKALAAERLVRMGYLKRLAGKLKLKAVMEWIDSFLQSTTEKLIVFAIHKEIITALRTRYKNCCTVIDGSTPVKQRQTNIERFLNSKKCSLFIGNIKAAGTGWSAKGVSTVLFAEIDWVPGLHTQAEDRTHGIGRGEEGRHCSIYYLVGRETLEEHLISVIQAKQKTIDSVLDGQTNGKTLDVYDLLCKSLQKKRKKVKK